MAFGKYVPKLVDRFSFQASMASVFPSFWRSIICLYILQSQSLYLYFKSLTYETSGELICPAYHELCSIDPVPLPGQCPNSCNFNGDCVDGRCHCFLGFNGHDCSKRMFLTPFHMPPFCPFVLSLSLSLYI